MNKKRSKKHHYLPRHYLRGFTNSENGFFVYDKHSKKIFLTSPDSAFFENDLNTTELLDGTQSDFLENQYAEIENKTYGSLDNIRSSKYSEPINHFDKLNLFSFLLFLHWRLPCNIKFVDQLSNDFFGVGNALDFFKIVSKTGEAVPQGIIERTKKSQIFKKLARQIIPFAPFFKDDNCYSDIQKWRFIHSGDDNNWYIVGDNPIITFGDSDHDPVRCLKNFIFPVSGRIILISRFANKRQVLPPEFGLQFGIGIIERANRFVACHNRPFLEALVDHHQLHVEYGKTDIIIHELFEMLNTT